MSDYNLYVKELELKNNILDLKFDYTESAYENQPILKLGYTYYAKQVREKLNDNDLKKRKIFLITNNFEEEIPDYDKDLNSIVPKSLSFDKDDKVFTRDFFKLWEIIKHFKFLNEKSVKSLSLCDNGGFLQCIYYFRNKYHSNKKDTYFYNGYTNKEISEVLKSKFKDNKLKKHEFGPVEHFDDSETLSDYNNIESIIKKNKLSDIDFITANGIVNYNNIEFKENNFFKLMLGIIIFALKTQKNGGNFILRFEDCFTIKTIKLFTILDECYDKIYVFKPLFSRAYSNEKYLICEKFNLNNTKKEKLINNLKNLLNNTLNLEKKNLHMNDIISDFEIPEKSLELFSLINRELVNSEHLNINKLIEYKNNKNYFGEQYHLYRNNQIKATEWWINKFLN